MKLYYAPGACSMAPHILFEEAKLKVDLVKVDLRAKKTASGEDFLKISPKGCVPTLQLDDGNILTEGPAISQYIADLAPASGLIPAAGTFERYRAQEWLNYISTEIHKGFSPLFNDATPEAYQPIAKANLAKRFDYIAEQLSQRPYLMGDHFSAPDAYLFTTLGWSRHVGIDLAPWPAIGAFLKRVGERSAVQAAMRAEGLIN